MGMTVCDEVKDSDMVRVDNQCKAMETSESEYNWYSERSRKMEKVDDGNSVEYI